MSYTILQKLNGDKIDVVEQITCYQMVHQPSVILLDHLVPNKLVHAVLNTVIVEVLQLIVNVTTALTIEQVRPFKCARKFSYSMDLATDYGQWTPNEGINQRYLKNWAEVADKICFGRT